MRSLSSTLSSKMLVSLLRATAFVASVLVSSALVSLVLVSSVATAQVQRPMPVVQRLEPTAGPPGTAIVLVGRHFDAQQTVWLGETPLEVGTRLPNRWTVTVPAGARSGAIEVRTERGNIRGPRFRVTEASPAPTITRIEPARGAAGSEVVLTGENFSARLAENSVHLGARPVVVRNANPTELRVIIPAGAETAPFRVSVAGAGEVTSEASFEVGTGTTVAGFEPPMGPPATHVTITGTGFHRVRSRVRVYLGEVRARVLRASETELEVEVPRRNAATGRWLIDVRGGGRAQSEQSFEIRLPPTITEMAPAFGAPGTRVTLTGAHFGADIRAVEARIGETALTVRGINDTQLVVEIPAGAASGHVEVTVRGLPSTRSRGELTVTAPVSVEGFTPRTGGAGTEVRIQGSGFSTTLAHDTVTLSGQPCEVVRATAGELVVRVPQAASGPLVVSVANAGESRTRAPFVVTRAPTIASFEPSAGAAGTVVSITGTNFGTRPGLIEVRLGERPVEVQNATDTELRVQVPEGASTGRLRVTVRLQGSATASRDFTVR